MFASFATCYPCCGRSILPTTSLALGQESYRPEWSGLKEWCRYRQVKKEIFLVWSLSSNKSSDIHTSIFATIVHPSPGLQWRHNGRDSVSKHQSYDCFLNRLFRRRSKNKSKLRVTGLCAGNSPGTGEFPAQMGSNAENVSIWWRHHAMKPLRGMACLSFYIRIKALQLRTMLSN